MYAIRSYYVADDAGIGKESGDVGRPIVSDSCHVEIMKSLTVMFAFSEDGQPTQPGLGPFEDQKFESYNFV